ncbi:hypothetical protein SPRG_01352 [Saprolegnia parasitica CBS 223.65]|uniref:Uncharacterized protein n=1 Tax=Saprolegnia parasitica (strain CBS 223.65) TaxID=695850 RepID=A0A067CU88_SAPPC|nr:hypothetical protein SPRG_01352 [Saprolegnia parasitica CBS 223.65]KDO34078.1 hypothetical protein SPRG_01352 [Saprolegnia parasitica CBS 223.65]|eukprot:XP_012194962.1 hypothetical protein SPRG_01352 [Saprolegnia parasitica CBS 223.65]
MASSSAVAAYIAATEVQDEVKRFFSKLFASTQLPPNPYPMLLDHFRRLEPSPAIMSTQEGPTTHVPTTSSSLSFASPASSGQFIARAHMAARLDVEALGRIYAALNASRLVTLYKTTTTDDAYTTTLFVVLVGRSVFAGPLPTMRAPLELQQHIVVQGEKLEKVIAIFVACLAKDVAMTTAENALTRGVVVTIPAYKSSDRATEKAWTHERVSASRSAFRSAVKAAVIAKARIYMCVYAPPTENEHCIWRITKEYILHHDATTTVHSFCDDASLVLAKGVFFDPDALRLYVARLCTACPERLQPDRILQAYASHDVFECFQELLLHVLRTPEAPPPPLLESILAVTSQPLLVTLSHIAESVRRILEVLDLTNDVQLVAPMLREIAVDGLAGAESSFLPPLQSFLTEHVLPTVVHLPDVHDGEYGSAYPRWHSSLYTLLGLVDGVVASLARDIALSERGVAALDHLKMLHTSSLPAATEKAATTSFFGIKKKKAASAPAPRTPGPPFASPIDALCVDVVAESEIALGQGRYPRAIATPVTQLQYVVDTRLDAALETALVPIMYEQALAPRRIYPTLVQRLGAKGAFFVLFQATGPELPTAMPLFRPASQLSTDNPMAVQYIDDPAPMAGTRHALALAPALVAATWAWLATAPSFLGVEDTVPSTLFSLSSRAALQADATWLWSHGHVVAFMEHIVVETVERSTAASTKAIERFSDAVLQDVLRLVARSDVLVVALAIGDNKVLGPKDLQSQRDLTRHWIEKAVRALDRIALSLLVDARVVSKAYLLHVAEASASLQAYTTQPLGLSQVFTTVAGAHQVLGSTLRRSEPSTAPSRLETWTAMYAASVETAPVMADCIRRCLCSSVVTLATAVRRLEALLAIAVYRTGDALLHLRQYSSAWLNEDVASVLRAPYLAAYVQPWASAYDGLVTALQANEMHDDVVSRLQRLRGVLLFVSLQWQSAVDGAIAEATARSASNAKCASG